MSRFELWENSSPVASVYTAADEGATQANAVDFTYRIERWTSIGILCNELSRSMGQPDVYPFALTLPVLRKLFFIERVISKVRLGAE